MKSNNKLQSAVFQLTPTRTRYDLFIIANEKKEKIASGLLFPFISHLKTAEDQIAKGGYSVLLEPEAGKDATWFTKGTVERFVRFVSTPEILERVYTTELAILQIDEAIAIQVNNDMWIEESPAKPGVSNEGNKAIPDANEEKAVVLFTPGRHSAEANVSIAHERNSKIQLLKVLETRRMMLQKEQGMAFARAAAAGFAMDHMAPLLSFAECFGASRLMDACLRFIDLWKRKHESGQWVEIEEAEAISSKSNFSTVVDNLNEGHIGLPPESNAEVGANTGVDERSSATHQIPVAQQEYFPGQFPHPMFPPWPTNSLPGSLPVCQPYPMQAIPFYQNYPSYYQPPFTPSEDSQFTADHSGDSKNHSEKGGKSGKKKSRTVVIRNINYVTTKQKNSSSSESKSASDSDFDSQNNTDTPKYLKYSKGKGIQEKQAADGTNLYGEEEMINGKGTDGGHWQAFQNCLLRATDKNNRVTNNDRGPKDDINGRNIVYRRNGKDDFLFGRQENQSNSSYQLDVNGFEGTANNLNKPFSHGVDDESFVIPFRAMSLRDKRTNIEMDPELRSKHRDSQNSSNRVRNQVNYEPEDLSFVGERGSDKRSTVYDPALDYDLRFSVKGTSQDKRNKEAITNAKDRRSKGVPDNKKSGEPIRRGKVSKMSPLDEARARAEKLRTYKSDLQKMKKEKEEAEKKRLDALKLERQKRIAARGRTMPSLQTRKSLPTKLTPISHKGSKFSDSEPKSSSPLQRSKLRTASLGSIDFKKASKVSKSSDERSKLRTASLGSVDSQKASKVRKLSDERSKLRTASLGSVDSQKASSKVRKSSDAKGNRLTRSASSLSEPKKERNGVTCDSKFSTARIRRLSEPKVINGSSTSMWSTGGPEVKKISTSRNIDQRKATTLSELKSKTLKRADSFGHNKSGAKEMKNSDKKLNKSFADENPIVDKTVVMLEYEQPSVSTKHALEEKMEMMKGRKGNFDTGEKIEVVSEYAAVRALPSSMDRVDREPIPRRVQGYRSSHEAITSHKEKESIKFSSINIAERPHLAPKTSLEMASKGVETAKAHVSDFKNMKLEKIPEAFEKPASVKEPSKGFKRLLKLGRRSHTSAAVDQSGKPDNASVNGSEFGYNATNHATSSEVHTLKNLISQEEEPSAGHTPEKSSRHFSLLSPFRSKSSEKKLIA